MYDLEAQWMPRSQRHRGIGAAGATERGREESIDEQAVRVRGATGVETPGPVRHAWSPGNFPGALSDFFFSTAHFDDLARAPSLQAELIMKVKEIMTVAPGTCTPDTTLAAAANLMWASDCGVLPVVDDGDLVGIVTDRDMLLALGTLNTRAIHLRVGAVATTRVSTCGPDDDVAGALETMKRARVRRLPVVDTNRRLVGIISISDIALAAREDGPVRNADVMDTLRAIWARRHQTTNRNAA